MYVCVLRTHSIGSRHAKTSAPVPLPIFSTVEYISFEAQNIRRRRWIEVPLSSLNCSENGGVIKGGAHESSNHALHRNEAVIVTQNVSASSRMSSSNGITVFFLFFSLFSPKRKNCQLYRCP